MLLKFLTQKCNLAHFRARPSFVPHRKRVRFAQPSFEAPCRDLLAGVSALLRPLGHTNLSNEFLMQILLYGDKDFTDGDILLLTLCFIHKTGLFD